MWCKYDRIAHGCCTRKLGVSMADHGSRQVQCAGLRVEYPHCICLTIWCKHNQPADGCEDGRRDYKVNVVKEEGASITDGILE
jgi:hypothetical protein